MAEEATHNIVSTLVRWVSLVDSNQRVDHWHQLADGVAYSNILAHMCRREFSGSELTGRDMLGNWVSVVQNVRSMFQDLDAFYAGITKHKALPFADCVDCVQMAKKQSRSAIIFAGQLVLSTLCKCDSEERFRIVLNMLGQPQPLDNAIVVELVEHFWRHMGEAYRMTPETRFTVIRQGFFLVDPVVLMEAAKRRVISGIPLELLENLFRHTPRGQGFSLPADDGRWSNSSRGTLLGISKLNHAMAAGLLARSFLETPADRKEQPRRNPLQTKLEGIQSPADVSMDDITHHLRTEEGRKGLKLMTAVPDVIDPQSPRDRAGTREALLGGEPRVVKDETTAGTVTKEAPPQYHYGSPKRRVAARKQYSEMVAGRKLLWQDPTNPMSTAVSDMIQAAQGQQEKKHVQSTSAVAASQQARAAYLRLQVYLRAHRERTRLRYPLDGYVAPQDRLHKLQPTRSRKTDYRRRAAEARDGITRDDDDGGTPNTTLTAYERRMRTPGKPTLAQTPPPPLPKLITQRLSVVGDENKVMETQ